MNLPIKMNSGLAPQWMIDRSRRIRLSNMCMCTATNHHEFSMETRLEALRRALSFWPEDSPERKCIIDQVPVLALLLNLSELPNGKDVNNV